MYSSCIFLLQPSTHFVYCSCMPSINITISTEAHARLASLKKAGQSFSDVILEHVYPAPSKNAGEFLDRLREEPPPYPAIDKLEEIRAGRGKRSNRSSK